MCLKRKSEKSSTNNSQKAGDNATQQQITNQIINYGITEERARDIAEEVAIRVIKENNSIEAEKLANKRVEAFNPLLFKRLKENNGLDGFCDPGFQILLQEAYKKVAATDSQTSYEMLSELLVERFKRKNDKTSKGAIAKAAEAIDYISDEALLGLTVVHAYTTFVPENSNITEGLKVLNNLFRELIYGDLPKNNEWADELDSFSAVRLDTISRFKKMEEYYRDLLSGYFVVGVKKGSSEHKEFVKKLEAVGLSDVIFIEHELNPGHLRLPVVNMDTIPKLKKNQKTMAQSGKVISTTIDLSKAERQAISEIFEKMQKNKLDTGIIAKELGKYESIKLLREWINSRNFHINTTPIGRILAHTNARRIDKNLPPLE